MFSDTGETVRTGGMSRSDSVSSSDMTDLIDEALTLANISNTPGGLSHCESRVVVCGSKENISTMEARLRELGSRNLVGCEVTARGGYRQYESLLNQLSVGDQVIFLWAVETKTGDLDDDLIAIFKSFLQVFAGESIKSMIVVVWYPGAMEDLRESIEDLTEAVRRNYQYNSPLGFPVLQYKPDRQFSTSLAQAVLKVQPFSISNITKTGDTQRQPEDPREPEPESNLVSAMKRFGGQEIEVISVHPQSDQEEEHQEHQEQEEHQEHQEQEEQEEQEQVLVTDPVVLIVGPPGHGKSSVGNLILGGEHFQIR